MKQIFAYFAHHRILVNIIVLLVVLGGGLSLMNTKQESFPSTELDMMFISVVYPGAAPVDVEINAVVPIEEELQKIVGIDKYTSSIVENAAIIKIELDQNSKNTQPIKDEIYRKMQNVPDVSPDVEEINVIDANPNLMSVYTIGVHVKEGTDGTQADVYKYVDMLEKKLIRLEGVAEVRMNGYVDPEVHIYVKPDRMRSEYISLYEIVESIRKRNVRLTGGDIQSFQKDETVVTIGEFENPMDVAEVIVRSSFDGKRIRVKDVADVKEAFEEQNVFMYVNKTPGVSLSIVKKETADIINTINVVDRFLAGNQDSLPDNLEITVIQDNSKTIRSLLNVVSSNLISGFILIFVILMIFLDTKSAIWTSVGMFLIILSTFIFMKLMDISFNTISLAAIITVLGMIVDNSIVVSENIFNFKNKGLKPMNAIISGVMDVVAPLVISSVTTITAFAPMLMVSGIMGKFINQFPKVIIFAIIVSLMQALFILPNQLSERRKKIKKPNAKEKKKFDKEKLFDPARKVFGKLLYASLKIRYIILMAFVLLLVFSVFLARDSVANFVLMYDNSADAIYIDIDAGVGTPLEKTREIISELENIALSCVTKEELVSLYALVGKNVDTGVVSEETGNLGGIMVYLVPVAERKRTAEEITSIIQEKVAKTDISQRVDLVKIATKGSGPQAGKAVDIKIIGNNVNYAAEIKNEIKTYLATLPGVYNIDDNQKPGKTEMVVRFNYEKLANLNINVATVSSEIRTAYNGMVATSLQRIDKKLDFRVQFADIATRDETFLKSLLIPNSNGRLIRLGDIARIEKAPGLATLQHYDGDRAVTVDADIETGKNTAKKVMQDTAEKFKDIPKRYEGMSLKFTGEVEETMDSLKALVVSFGVAIFLIYLVLLFQFGKVVQPLLVLIIIPFGLIGVLIAFAIHGMPLSFMGFIGIIGLAGVVVNNGIVMVDLINKIMDENGSSDKKAIIESVVEGAQARFRPVMLTSLTTILGLLPTVYGIGGRADVIVPIVMALAYGLLFATVLTLIFLPCLFVTAVDFGLIKPTEKDEEDDTTFEQIRKAEVISILEKHDEEAVKIIDKHEHEIDKHEDEHDEKIKDDEVQP